MSQSIDHTFTLQQVPDGLVEKKEVMNYPPDDIHFVIKHGEEIEQNRGFNSALTAQSQIRFTLDREGIANIVESARLEWWNSNGKDGRSAQHFIADALVAAGPRLLRVVERTPDGKL